jgi:hypothetical protein
MDLLDPRHYRLDDILRRPYTPTTPFGASGDCLWATSPQGWGFRNGVHWVHRTYPEGMSPFTLRLRVDGEFIEPADALYRPSHVTLNGVGAESGVQITEDKFITRDDVVVSVLSLRNPGESVADVEIDLQWGIPSGFNELRRGIAVYVHREGPPGDDLRLRVPPGYRLTLVFAVAFAPTREEAERRAARWRHETNPVRTQVDAYQKWFDQNIPRFDCSDIWLTKMWYHRWYVVRKNHLKPGVGLTLEETFTEGKWNSEWYSASITYGAGHILRETRWLQDAEYARNYFRGFARNQREDGLYRSWYVDGIARPDGDEGKYTDWITAAVWDLHLVHPDERFLREARPALEKNVAYWQTHDWDNDGLLVVDSHWWTGMEWQPSFFYTTSYELGERRDGNDVQNPVKRLDLTSYQYANVTALAKVQHLLGNEDAARDCEALAAKIQSGVEQKMWDQASGFLYDLLPGTDEKMRTAKTIAAFYPFYAGINNNVFPRAWSHLTEEFWTTYPPASTATDSPAYSQEKEMKGKPLTICYWNGPTWPHANSLVISGLARSLQTIPEEHSKPGELRKALFDMLQSFGRVQFEEGDYSRPLTGEFYRGDTGQWMTPERDYNHSTWADLIITTVAGLVPRADDVLEVSPLLPPASEGGWTHFCLENIPYHGRRLTLVWDDPSTAEDAYQDGDKGFTVYVDGVRLYHQEDLSSFMVNLPPISRYN